jgi:polyphosphate kinase
MAKAAEKDLTAIGPRSRKRFINRELSWLAFNERVLEEAMNESHPLLERLRFLSISGTNLDEFFIVRMAGLRAQVRAGVSSLSQDGRTPVRQFSQVNSRAIKLMVRQQDTWRVLRKELADHGLAVVHPSDLNEKDRLWLDEHFTHEIFPVLTPLAADPAHPFPFIPNGGMSLALSLRRSEDGVSMSALLPLPNQIPRFIRLPGRPKKPTFVKVEDVICQYLDSLFPGFEVEEAENFRVLRDSDVEIEEKAEDLLLEFESLVRRRKRGSAISLRVSSFMSKEMRDSIIEELDVQEDTVFQASSLIGIGDLNALIVPERRDLLFDAFVPRFPERVRDFDGDYFAVIRAKDLLVHHPYETFDVVVQFVRQAARDPDVVAIKQTLYRTSDDSPIVRDLIEAAEAGKNVTALVELKARFDEEANIRQARRMEAAGVHIVYGVMDLKTHAKMTLVVRREAGGLRSYVHFGTGNYHPDNARVYTDLSYFTCDPDLCRDAARVFNFTTGYGRPGDLDKLVVAPFLLRDRLIELIDEEKAHAEARRPATIWAKLNALVDGKVIDALYRASGAGVQISLVVRGICCLRPGIPGLSENITVKSVVGRFLEHSRIVCFGAGHPLPSPEAKVFLSSADWMPRNLDRRIEHLVPIENPTVHQQILEEIMVTNLRDNLQCWYLQPDRTYVRGEAGSHPFSAHRYFMSSPKLSGRGTTLKEPPPA